MNFYSSLVHVEVLLCLAVISIAFGNSINVTEKEIGLLLESCGPVIRWDPSDRDMSAGGTAGSTTLWSEESTVPSGLQRSKTLCKPRPKDYHSFKEGKSGT